MKNLTLENAVAAVRGDYIGDHALLRTELSAVTTDSRSVTPGCLFAAIRGERADGHDYIPAAFAQGALAVLAEKMPKAPAGPVLLVRSTEKALQSLAAFYRAQFDCPVLGVTGSVGKTTAKEMCAAVLSQRFPTLKTQGNFNNGLGVPLTLFRLEETHRAAVVEMGVSHFGEMQELADMAQPDMALYTAIGHAHLEAFGDLDGVLREKGKMIDALPAHGAVFVCGDDALLRAWDTGTRKKVLFGTTPDCDVYAENVRSLGLQGTGCDVVSGSRRIPVVIPAFGLHIVYAALGAAAVGLQLGLTDEEIASGIAAYAPVGSRCRTVQAPRCTVIDDCYNANPTSVAASLASLASLPGRRVCILGDMFELGENSAALHRAVGECAAEYGIEQVIACGELAKEIYAGARAAENAPLAWHFPDRESLLDVLDQLIRKGDTVLVKASHSAHFETLVSALEALA